MQSDDEDEIDELMNDFDTKFIAPEEIRLTDNPDNVGALTLESNVCINNKRTTHTKEVMKNRKIRIQKKVPQ